MTIVQIDKQTHLTGQTMRTLQEARGLKSRGHRVILVCQPGSFLEQGARQHSIDFFPLSMKHLFPAVIKLGLFLRRERVDVINSHGYTDHLLSVLAGKSAGVSVQVRTKHNHVPLKGGILSRYLYGRLTDRIVAISEHIRSVMIASGLPPWRVVTISTAVNLKDFIPREKNSEIIRELNLPPDCSIIGIVARLTERKGFTVLFEAVKRLSDENRKIVCLIVGGGVNSKKIDALRDSAESLGVSGYLYATGKRNDIPDMLSIIDIFVLPSLAEGLGRSLLEAMGAGKPIVASRVGGIPEAIEDGKSGILVPPGDSHELAKAIARLMDYPLKAQKLGRDARARAELLFDEEKLIDRLCRLYEDLIVSGMPAVQEKSTVSAD